MSYKHLLTYSLIIASVFQACKKTDDQLLANGDINKLTDVIVPEGFLWESSRDVTFKVAVTDTRFSDATHIIAIYTPDGKLLSKGSASTDASFETKVYVPSSITEVYVIKTAPDNSTVNKKVELSGAEVNISLGAINTTVSSTKSGASTFATSPDCNTGCTQSVSLTSSGQWITIDGGKTVCISGSNKIVNLTFGNGGGIARLCGTDLTVQNINKNAGSSAIGFVVTNGSRVSFPGLEFDRATHVFSNYGTAKFTGNLASSGTVNNYGDLTVTSDFNLNSSNITDTNEGTISVGGTMNVNSTTTFENKGSATVNNLQINGGGIVNNRCKLLVSNSLMNNNLLNNYSYVQVSGNTQINGSAQVNLYDASYFKTKDLDKITGGFSASGSTSMVKVTGTINSNLILDAQQTSNGQKFKGNLRVCYGSTLPSGLFKDGASQGCDLYIPATGCNPGNGMATIVDSDGDGVADNLDDYPNDASKAFNNYYPNAAADAGATIAFEDMWPVKGDYDMNDVVFSYKLKVITNAGNKVVQVDGNYELQARGGIFQNGFGIEFPVKRELIGDVTGGSLEAGQEKAVITLFDNTHSEMLYYNTRLEEPKQTAKSYNISFTIANGPSLASFGLGEYNPFIWNKNAGRGSEIHLPGKTPTTLADKSLFGTGDDRSNVAAGKYYLTAEGYPWAISVPVKNFVYPLEGKDISTAYLKLPNWILSGGTQYTDWYANTGSGYRNSVNLFSK
ncbi:LruC domain-containing protein [Desertivirga brevis]|uniref:LruC domain-containing protein n=1 Tax=Desertivirga brevis TaxID=2810310 RepID=UPI001A96A31A|nr:LruC domain-containing protein [Pedobacter sp. SYSU D00873]